MIVAMVLFPGCDLFVRCLHDLHGAWIEKVAHLLGDLSWHRPDHLGKVRKNRQ